MVKGDHKHDYRLDIWCIGVLTYEMLFIDVPFKSNKDIIDINYNYNLVKLYPDLYEFLSLIFVY